MTEEFKKARDEWAIRLNPICREDHFEVNGRIAGADWAYEWCKVELNFDNQDDIKKLMNMILNQQQIISRLKEALEILKNHSDDKAMRILGDQALAELEKKLNG